MTKSVSHLAVEFDNNRIFERTDGFYWQSATGKEHGPYPTLKDAVDALPEQEFSDIGGDDSLEDAETEMGISTWIDPDTGAPAEEGIPRLEDH